MTTTQEIIARIKANQEQLLSEDEKQQEARWQALADAVLRSVTDQERKGDDALLASLATDLEISDSYLASHFAKAKEATDLLEQHKALEENEARYLEARQERDRVRAECKQRLADADRALFTATASHDRSATADTKLRSIMNSFGRFFAGGDPTRLRIKACAKPPAVATQLGKTKTPTTKKTPTL